jgi:hypothetical protein
MYGAYHSYNEAQRAAFKTAKELLLRGFATLRVRAEAMLHNKECPVEDFKDDADYDPKHYFEFHAKLVAVPPEKFAAFTEILKACTREGVGKYARGSISFKLSKASPAC